VNENSRTLFVKEESDPLLAVASPLAMIRGEWTETQDNDEADDAVVAIVAAAAFGVDEVISAGAGVLVLSNNVTK